MSENWINKWKTYVCFEKCVNTRKIPLNDYDFGLQNPGNFNEDLILGDLSKYLLENEDEIILKQGLKNNDYCILPYEIMNIFYKNYPGIIIHRKAYISPKGEKKVEINYFTVN